MVVKGIWQLVEKMYCKYIMDVFEDMFGSVERAIFIGTPLSMILGLMLLTAIKCFSFVTMIFRYLSIYLIFFMIIYLFVVEGEDEKDKDKATMISGLSAVGVMLIAIVYAWMTRGRNTVTRTIFRNDESSRKLLRRGSTQQGYRQSTSQL